MDVLDAILREYYANTVNPKAWTAWSEIEFQNWKKKQGGVSLTLPVICQNCKAEIQVDRTPDIPENTLLIKSTSFPKCMDNHDGYYEEEFMTTKRKPVSQKEPNNNQLSLI